MNMNNINIKIINYNSKEYKNELKLRNKILRKPLGLSIYDENLENEKNDIHIGAFLDGQLVGTVLLKKLNHNQLKMRQLAVKESLQGNKIGTGLVKYAENYAHKKGYNKIVLNARKTVVDFYLKLGYIKKGNQFTEVTIPHFKMEKHF